MTEHADVRTQMEADLRELYSRSDRIDEHWKNNAAHKDWEELAIMRENDEVISSLDDRTRKQIREIEAALERIALGTWGDCVKCGEPISSARLEIMPTVATCIDCASRQEAAQNNQA